MSTEHDTPEQPDFDAIETDLRNQSEQYRERHLSVKLSLYAGFFAFEGIAVAAAAFVAGHSPWIAAIVIVISFLSMIILFPGSSISYPQNRLPQFPNKSCVIATIPWARNQP